MSDGIEFSYILIFFLSCIDYYFHYKFINYIKKDLTKKQKAHILSIKSSLTLFLIGVFFNYYYFSSGCSQEKFLSILEEKGTLNFGKLVVLYFAAYLLTDIWVGHHDYPEYMKSLSGNFHHVIYIGVSLLSLYTGLYPLYLLHMMSELPTFFLSIGSFDTSFRHDNLFGATFFITRIVYHLILTLVFRQNKLLLYLSLAALGLHIYWFYGWFKKYGKKLFQKSQVKDCSSYYKKETRKNNQKNTETHTETKEKQKNKIKLKKKKA
jgi:hypothetical protein